VHFSRTQKIEIVLGFINTLLKYIYCNIAFLFLLYFKAETN